MGKGLPPEIEEGMDGLDFDPPTSSFKCLSYELRIIAGHYDILIAIFDVCILKRYFGFLLIDIYRISIKICRCFLWMQLFYQALRDTYGAVAALH